LRMSDRHSVGLADQHRYLVTALECFLDHKSASATG
jgi:hypothetical protein